MKAKKAKAESFDKGGLPVDMGKLPDYAALCKRINAYIKKERKHA